MFVAPVAKKEKILLNNSDIDLLSYSKINSSISRKQGLVEEAAPVRHCIQKPSRNAVDRILKTL